VTQSRSGRHRNQNYPEPEPPRKPLGGRKLAAAAGALALVAGLAAAAVHSGAFGGRSTSLSADAGPVPMLGSSVYSTSDLAADTQAFGHMPIVRIYYPGLPAANAWTSGLPAANKSAVIVSFKALPTTILSGADDAALKQFFDTAPTGHPIYWTYYHEPEDNIADGQFSVADYKAAWAHIVQLADAAHNTSLIPTLILMEYDLIPAAHRNWKDYLPGGNIIKVLGWDAYPVGSATGASPLEMTPATGFMGPAIAASKSVGLPYGFAEFALDKAGDRGPWLDTVGKYIMSSGALFGTYFNGNAQYPAMRLTDSPSATTWHKYVAESNGGTTAAPPEAPPSAPPSSPPASSSATGLTGLGVSPATLTPDGTANVKIAFTLGHAANVTVCILNSDNTVVRQISRPGLAAGSASISYYGFNGHSAKIPAGKYTVLIVASNGQGSDTAEGNLTITP
jgi:hypothetical protein